MSKSGTGALLLAVAVNAGVLMTPGSPAVQPVQAHCPGTAAHDYAAGGQGLGAGVANGVRVRIDWTQGNVCTSGVSHSITVCSTGACGDWAQVGWRYYNGYAEPKMYCEWAGGQYKIVEFAITHVTHEYRMQFDTQDKYWDCYLDTTFKYSYYWTSAGMTSGSYLVSQGENHQAHVQIGRMAPAKLLFDAMKYKKTSDGTWVGMNVAPGVSSGPYGADEPAVGDMRVWTNAH